MQLEIFLSCPLVVVSVVTMSHSFLSFFPAGAFDGHSDYVHLTELLHGPVATQSIKAFQQTILFGCDSSGVFCAIV